MQPDTLTSPRRLSRTGGIERQYEYMALASYQRAPITNYAASRCDNEWVGFTVSSTPPSGP